jgi:Tol biopolymer transport system component
MKCIKTAAWLGVALLVGGCGHLLNDKRTHTYDTVYITDADGTNVVQVSPDLDYHYGQADWAPDGTQIAYASSDLGDIFVSAISGGDAVNLTNTTDQVEHTPKWSPDGTRMAYYVRAGSQNAVYVRLADGSNPVLILENVSQFAWSPDSAYLSVVSAEKLYLVEAASGDNDGVYAQNVSDDAAVTWLSTTKLRYVGTDTTTYCLSLSPSELLPLRDISEMSLTLPQPQMLPSWTDDGYYTVSTTGSVQKVLSHASYATLSADASHIVSVYQNTLYRHTASGTGSEVVFSATDGQLGIPVLSETHMIFTSGSRIYLGEIASGLPTQIATGLDPKLSPDGSKITYVGFRRVSE